MSPFPARIAPLTLKEFSDQERDQIGGFTDMNFVRVMMRHPELSARFMPLLMKVIPESSLPVRDRQILVLRTLELYGEEYENAHHVLISQRAGMTDAEIAGARTASADLTDFDQVLTRAAEELVRDLRIGDQTWKRLAERYSQIELMEVVSLVGCYTMMAMFTKTYGIQLEDEDTFNGFASIRQYT